MLASIEERPLIASLIHWPPANSCTNFEKITGVKNSKIMIAKLAINRYRAIFTFQDKTIDNTAKINTVTPMISKKSETSPNTSVASIFLETIKLE